MNINIVCVGRLKEKYWTDAVNEYAKRLGRYAKIKIIELNDEKAPENLSDAQKIQVMEKEGDRILKSIPSGSFVVALEIDGKNISSEELASFIKNKMVNGVSDMTFVIGGSLGLSKEVTGRAHQMARVMLLEQIYRAERIICNEPYHK